MVDNEKRENLANARRKLKKFRDQQQPNNSETNGNNLYSNNGTSAESPINSHPVPQTVPNFIDEQQTILNGIHQNLSKSPVAGFEEQNRQYGLLIDNQKQERTRLENQRQVNSGNNMSRRSSQTSVDIEQKLHRDVEHLQEQLEIHVQTIGILVAEKTDVSAKLTQSFKQLERKQGEMDELHGRLKASRERVLELEKQMQNSTSNVQKREMAAKESDKENDRLKIENIRQSQLVEDLKQNINELNEKLNQRQNNINQLNTELEQLKKQPQSINETSIIEQQINELQQTITEKNIQMEELLSSINRMRSDNEQYQQYNTNMQQHIQELNDQINQLTQTNKQNEMNLSDHSSVFGHDNLQQENQLFRNAIDQWSTRYEELRLKLEHMTKLLTEKDEHITELERNINNSKLWVDQDQLNVNEKELESNEIIHLKDQIQIIEDLNKQLNQRLEQFHSKANHEQEIQTDLVLPSELNNQNASQQQLTERFTEAMRENVDLKERTQHLEHVVLQLQSETETIGDYIHLYQQQREQLQRRYQEKDDYIKQLTQDRLNLQRKLSELEILLIHGLNIPIMNSIQSQQSDRDRLTTQDESTSSNQSELNTSESGQSETMNNVSSTMDQTNSLNSTKTTSSMLLPQLNDETKARIFALIKELGQNNASSSSNDNRSTIKLAFVDKNLYICSTCSGPVQWV